jgi:hypothetical protein
MKKVVHQHGTEIRENSAALKDITKVRWLNLNVVFTGVNRVYRQEIQSVMFVFSTPPVN